MATNNASEDDAAKGRLEKAHEVVSFGYQFPDEGADDDFFQQDIEAHDEQIKFDVDPDEEPPTVPERSKQYAAAEEKQIVRSFIRKYSSLIKSRDEHSVDKKRLQRALKDSGMYAYGVQAISVWMIDEEEDRLTAPPGGFWYNPDEVNYSESLTRLTDEHHPQYVPMDSVAPGTDLAGILWLETNKQQHRVSSFVHRGEHKDSVSSLNGLYAKSVIDKHSTMIWRDLNSLVQDPDTAKGPRLALLQKAGFGRAAGITFRTGVSAGMIIFYARDDVDEELLNSMSNVSYMRQSAHFIGTAAAITEARRATLGQRLEKQQSMGLAEGDEENIFDEDDEESDEDGASAQDQKAKEKKEEQKSADLCQKVPKRLRVWVSKFRGGGLQIPPSLSFRQSLWTALGAFCGLFVLSCLNDYYKILTDDDYWLLIGPFGALMTLQYGLTAAPASQPRNAVLGQAVSGAVSLAFTYIPEDILPVWLRRAVGPAVAIATMVRCGFTHPPAGAHAVLYASGKYNFAFYSLVVLSSAIACIPATLVNNMSRKRQYPTYWGFVKPEWVKDIMKELYAAEEAKEGKAVEKNKA